MEDTRYWLLKNEKSYNEYYKTYRAEWCRLSGLPMLGKDDWEKCCELDLYTVSRAKVKHVSIDMKNVRGWYKVHHGYVPMFKAVRE